MLQGHPPAVWVVHYERRSVVPQQCNEGVDRRSAGNLNQSHVLSCQREEETRLEELVPVKGYVPQQPGRRRPEEPNAKMPDQEEHVGEPSAAPPLSLRPLLLAQWG